MAFYANVPQASRTYTVDQGFALASASAHAGFRHLLSAADFISQLLRGRNIPFAIMGGFSLGLRGSQRQTHDVDIATGCNMGQLIQAIAGQQRILRPAGPVSGVMRIYVQTGGDIDPGIPDLYVMVDLILSGGSLGAPDNVQASSEVIAVNTDLGPKNYPVLNILSITRSKLAAYFERASQNDYTDIAFLVERFGQRVRAVRGQLNKNHCRRFFDMYKARVAGDQNRINWARNVLGVA
ncbi:hypothetical protein PRK78_000595 [Emydomyces testavorans]|uniref:Uncharacterized protein n=1 Tax=Emydomyces testavorans TaxID=2070801 RepID=A0AAF0IG09_9EURO|nr:hypothetical protein PRK78_000595 [Emydomyces testavorans]